MTEKTYDLNSPDSRCKNTSTSIGTSIVLSIGTILTLRPEPANRIGLQCQGVWIKTIDISNEAAVALNDGRLKQFQMSIDDLGTSAEWQLGYIPAVAAKDPKLAAIKSELQEPLPSPQLTASRKSNLRAKAMTDRTCGECFACCKWLGIDELKKWPGETCIHINNTGDSTKMCSSIPSGLQPVQHTNVSGSKFQITSLTLCAQTSVEF